MHKRTDLKIKERNFLISISQNIKIQVDFISFLVYSLYVNQLMILIYYILHVFRTMWTVSVKS